MNGGVTRVEVPVCGDLVTTRCTQVGQTTRSYDEVNEGLMSRAMTVLRRQRDRQLSLPNIVNLAKHETWCFQVYL